MDDAALAAVSDENLASAFASLARSSPDGAEVDHGGAVVRSVGVPIAFFNQLHVFAALDDPASALDAATSWLRDRGLPFIVVLAPGSEREASVLRSLGLRPDPDEPTHPGMAMHPIVEAPAGPDELVVEDVADLEGFRRWVAVTNAGFGIDPEHGERIGSPALLREDGVRAFLGRVDGEPVCSGVLVEDPEGVAGIYNIATLERFRRRGLGEAMTWHALEAGRAAGCTTAVLQASEMGYGIYHRMGFRLVRPYEVYVPA